MNKILTFAAGVVIGVVYKGHHFTSSKASRSRKGR